MCHSVPNELVLEAVMATLYERNGHFYLNYSVNGRRIRKAVGNNKRDAEVYLNELHYKLFKGDVRPERPKVPVVFFLDHYLANCSERLSNGTVIRYRGIISHLRQFFTTHYPIQFIGQIGKGAMQGYVIYRQNCRPKPKAKTINMELATLRSALMWALDNDWIEKNPASRVKMLKTNDSKSGQIINEEEIELLMDGCNELKEGVWFRDLLITFLNTGMRLGELINLTWNDIVWDQRIIKIQDKPFWQPKTYKRDIPVNHTVESLLERLRTRQKGIYVFTRGGKKIKSNVPRKILIKLAKKVGLNHITRIHDFRHTFASNLLMKGVDIPTVQALLGHKSWSTTLIYSHQTKEHTRKAVERLI